MIFVTGPMFAGKRDYIRRELGLDESAFAACAVWDVERLAAGREDLSALAEELARYRVVIATETGCGVVPVEERQRRDRECAGRLACLLAERADTVIRVCCGLPQFLKGTL